MAMHHRLCDIYIYTGTTQSGADHLQWLTVTIMWFTKGYCLWHLGNSPYENCTFWTFLFSHLEIVLSQKLFISRVCLWIVSAINFARIRKLVFGIPCLQKLVDTDSLAEIREMRCLPLPRKGMTCFSFTLPLWVWVPKEKLSEIYLPYYCLAVHTILSEQQRNFILFCVVTFFHISQIFGVFNEINTEQKLTRGVLKEVPISGSHSGWQSL